MKKKELMKQQRVRGSKEKKKELRRIGKEIKKSLKTDEEEYWKERLCDQSDSKNIWASVKDLLGERKNLSPTFIMKKDSAGNTITVNKTEEVAVEFNEFFTDKIKKLQEKTMNNEQ